MKPRIGKRAFIPARLLDLRQIRQARKSLTYKELVTQRMQAIMAGYGPDTGEVSDVRVGERVEIDEFVPVPGGWSVPRVWAQHLAIDYKDTTVAPHMGIKIPGKITPRDDQQADFFGNLIHVTSGPGSRDVLANAATGSGKSVAGIYLGQHYRYRTLIVVDSNKIANDWLKNFRQFYGDEFVKKYVGRVQRDKCEWRGKGYSIALAQSLARRDYGHEFYRAFGIVVLDEVQVFGGPHFAPILGMFPARIRVGFTATNRSGQFGQMIRDHIAKAHVVSEQEVLKPQAWVITNKMDKLFYGMTDGALLSNLSQMKDRNEKLVKLIYERGYKRNRNVLVLSNRTAQLFKIGKALQELGVPEEAIGLHMGKYETDRFVVYYRYEDSTSRRSLTIKDTRSKALTAVRQLERGEYDKFDLPKALCNRLQRGEYVEFETDREIYAPSQAELDNITHSCDIILATYEIFSKGVNVPRLDMGVEALPSGNVTQPLGRVLRLHEGKETPEWYAIHDRIELPGTFGSAGNPMAGLLNAWFDGKTKQRTTALRKAGARIKFQ